MAWKPTLRNGYSVLTDTIRTYSTKASLTDAFVVPPGCDFQVIANYNGTNLSTSTRVELFVSDEPTGTFQRRIHTPFVGITSDIDNATKILTYDNSLRGQFGAYKLKVPKGGGLVKFSIIIGAPDAS